MGTNGDQTGLRALYEAARGAYQSCCRSWRDVHAGESLAAVKPLRSCSRNKGSIKCAGRRRESAAQ